MKAKMNGRYLRIAIAGSLCVHLLIALIIHSKPLAVAAEQPPGKTDIMRIHLPPPTPTPRPQRPQTPQKAQHNVMHRPQMHRPHVRPSKNGPPNANVIASAQPGTPSPWVDTTPGAAATSEPQSPAPSPTPRPACSAPDVDAHAIEVAQAETPPDAPGVQAEAKVKVDLDANGNITSATIYTPTGYPQLDRAAIDAAKQSRYEAEKRDCKSVPGSYLFTVDFDG